MRNYEGTKFCQWDLLQTNALCKLPSPTFKWFHRATFTDLSREKITTAFNLAWSFWKKHIQIWPTQTEVQKDAKVYIESGFIDGRNGVLAWAELPCPDKPQLRCRFDEGDQYTVTETTLGLDLVRVAAHEFGHLLGIGHIESGNLMAPYYSGTIREPQAGDIREALARYLPSQPLPPPGPDPTPPKNCPEEICDLLTLILSEIRVISAKFNPLQKSH